MRETGGKGQERLLELPTSCRARLHGADQPVLGEAFSA